MGTRFKAPAYVKYLAFYLARAARQAARAIATETRLLRNQIRFNIHAI